MDTEKIYVQLIGIFHENGHTRHEFQSNVLINPPGGSTEVRTSIPNERRVAAFTIINNFGSMFPEPIKDIKESLKYETNGGLFKSASMEFPYEGGKSKLITIITEEEKVMEPKTTNGVIGTVEIPDALAHELSELLIKQNIRERVLVQLVDQPDKYEAAEKMLMPIVGRIEAIKVRITREFIPEQYNDDKYMWNYNGYEINGNHIEIMKK